MMEEDFKNHLQMKVSECESIFEQLDAAPKKAINQEVRRDKRWSYRATDVPVIVLHPGGSEVRILVCTRNLSAGGVGFLHGGYLHAGSKCTVMLNAYNDVCVAMAGHIAYCRHIIGRHHEVGVCFVEKLDPATILGKDFISQLEAEDDNSDMPTLFGKVLLVDYAECDRKLLESQLRAAGLKIKSVISPGLALDAVKRSTFDLIICDPALEPSNTTPLIKRMRDQGFDKPIILLTAETNREQLSKLGADSASDRLSKPYCIESLFLIIGRYLKQPVPQTPIYSSFENRPDVAKLLPGFIKGNIVLRQQLEKALDAKELIAARKCCRSIQGSGSIYGFEPVTVAARDAVRQLDRSKSVSESSNQVQLLIDICRCLQCSREVVQE